MATFIRLLRDARGASAAEYALILAIVGTAIAAAALALGGAINTSMTNAADCIAGSAKCSADETAESVGESDT